MAAGRALIVGGGIGGIALANSLGQRGIEVVVFEQAHKLEPIGAAIGVQTNAIKALRTYGRAAAVLAAGVPIETYEYRSWNGRALYELPQGEIGRQLGEPTVVLDRASLQDALLGGLGEGIVRLDAEVTGFEEGDHGVTARFQDGKEERGDMLVGADGIHSPTRVQLFGENPLRYSGWIAWRAIAPFEHPSFPVGFARQWLGRGRSFGMWHLSGGRVYWVGTARMPAGGSDAPGGRKQEVLSWFRSGQAPIAELIEATDEGAIIRNDVFDRVPSERWSRGRVTLVGDAAHATTPVTGQGGGLAIEDAAVLGREFERVETLQDAAAVASAFAAYEAERLPRTTAITKEAWILSKLHHWRNPVVCSLRDVSLRLQPQKVWRKRMETRLDSFKA